LPSQIAVGILKHERVDVNVVRFCGNAALLMAASYGRDAGIVCDLLKSEKIDVNAKNHYGDTVLMRACQRGALGVVIE
jgi:ankyrin repeat protein